MESPTFVPLVFEINGLIFQILQYIKTLLYIRNLHILASFPCIPSSSFIRLRCDHIPITISSGFTMSFSSTCSLTIIEEIEVLLEDAEKLRDFREVGGVRTIKLVNGSAFPVISFISPSFVQMHHPHSVSFGQLVCGTLKVFLENLLVLCIDFDTGKLSWQILRSF